MRTWNSNNLYDTFFINYASMEEGQQLISAEDPYINSFSQFDLDSRCGHTNATKEDYIALCKQSVRDFLPIEIGRLEELFFEIQSELERRGMVIPELDSINIVKTSSNEESGAIAYTRGNTIFLSSKIFAYDDGFMERVLTHELFHILTRSSFEFKKEIYRVIGFTATEKQLDRSAFDGYHFCSNPDTEHPCNYITIDGRNYMMLPLAREKYKGQNFFNSFIVYLTELDSSGDLVLDENGRPILHNITEYKDKLVEKMGNNTNYWLDPEETLAENFRLAVLGTIYALPNPEIIERIRDVMKAR